LLSSRPVGPPGRVAGVVGAFRAADGAAEGAQVAHVAVLPQERVQGRDPRRGVDGRAGVGLPGDLAGGVEGGADRVRPAERADVPYHPVCQMNDRAWVPQPKSEYGSGMAIDPQAERCTAHGACSAVLLLVRW